MGRRNDERTADEFGLEQALRCRAHGCPCAWSVDLGEASKLCSAHALAADRPNEWRLITQRLVDEETDRALYGAPAPPPAPSVTREQGLEALAAVRAGHLFEREGAKGWARRLEAAEAAGRSLSKFQKQAWRQALAHRTLDAAQQGAPIPRTRITDALQATGDLPTEETL